MQRSPRQVQRGEREIAVAWSDPSADPELLARAAANFVEQYRLLGRWAAAGTVVDLPGATLICTGYARDTLNPAIVYGDAAEPGALVAGARRFYAERGVPWCLRGIGPIAALLDARAVELRIVRGQGIPVMLLAPVAGEPVEIAGLAIRRVCTEAELAIFRDTALRGFDMTADVADAITPLALLGTPDVAYYVGYLDGQPVATASRVTAQRTAGIYNVSTLREHRKRGIGAAITWRAALDGYAEGCVCAALQATDMGFNVYRRMGFRHVADYTTWRPLP
jgi:GNAT superfamily N-acetyltransferase